MSRDWRDLLNHDTHRLALSSSQKTMKALPSVLSIAPLASRQKSIRVLGLNLVDRQDFYDNYVAFAGRFKSFCNRKNLVVSDLKWKYIPFEGLAHGALSLTFDYKKCGQENPLQVP